MKRSTTTILAGVALAGMAGAGIAAAADEVNPVGRVADALKSLVDDKTLTQEQADAVAKALEDARDEAWADREERRAEREAELESMFQDALGMSADDVRAQLQEGKTLREIAGDNADKLAEAFTTQAKEHLAEEVEEGHLTQERADAMLENLEARAQAWLDGTDDRGLGFGLGGPRMGHGRGGHHHGMGGPGGWGPDPDTTDGTDDSSTSTTVWVA